METAFPGFLPSSFSMYAISLASALALLDKPAMAVAVAATGVIIGWPFSVLAFLPVTFFSLRKSLKQAFVSGTIISVALLVSLAKMFLQFVITIYWFVVFSVNDFHTIHAKLVSGSLSSC